MTGTSMNLVRLAPSGTTGTWTSLIYNNSLFRFLMVTLSEYDFPVLICEGGYRIANAMGNRVAVPVPCAITTAGASAKDVSWRTTVNFAPGSMTTLEPPENVTRPRMINLSSLCKLVAASEEEEEKKVN